MSLKVLFTLTPAFNPNSGGVQRTTFKLGKYFTEQGLQVFYYSLEATGHVAVEFGKLYAAPAEGRSHNPENIADLRQALNQLQPDIVINQMPYDKELRELLADQKTRLDYTLLGCLRNSLFSFKNNARDKMQQSLPGPAFRLMDNSFGLSLIQKRHRLRHRKDLKAIIDQHDFFILLAPPNREELHYFVGDYKADKVIAIPNSIPEVYEGEMQKDKIIVHVGRFDVSQKRSDLLLDFWKHTFKELPDWKFVLVGDGPYRPQLEADLKRLELPRVELEGYQKPEPYYKRAAIFMMPSAYEGFPNTILEAQSFGCAVLAFDNYPALSWIVNAGEDALLSHPFDTRQMAQQAIALANDDARLISLQQMAQQNAARFTIEQVGKQWLNLFNELTVVA